MSDASRPTALGELLRAYLERSGIGARVEEATLFVEVRNSAWLMELNMMQRDFLERVNERIGDAPFQRVVFALAETE